ncbi:MAG: chorismate mutase [Bacteroidales bacterium]|nr:chorismate mutase [Bacteroidales bacterium]
MNELEEARQGIAEVDKEIASLFERRMRLAGKVLDYKKGNGLPILDAAQEERVIARNASNIADPAIQEYYVLFLRDLMKLSKAYQGRLMNGMKIAYCGVPGAFAHIAAESIFPQADIVPYPDFESAYRACETGEADTAILPIENSFAGDVGGVMDLTFQGSLYINLMLELDVHQNLLGIPGARPEDIRTVVSHPQALAQCARFITERGFDVREFSNTAAAAEYVSSTADKSIGAIASRQTASLYGLEVLEAGINSAVANQTRFAVFSRARNKTSQPETEGEHFILVFTVRNEAGALAKILNIIGSHGFNMSSLHSRPVAGPLWNHYFFAELEGGVGTENGRDLLRQLETVCDRLKMIGAYKSIKI